MLVDNKISLDLHQLLDDFSNFSEANVIKT
jgi:hypothetical protein